MVKTHHQRLLTTLFAVVSFISVVFECQAFTVRHGDTTIEQTENQIGDLVFIGDSLVIKGKVEGDIFAFGRTLIITKTGQVHGDIMAVTTRLQLDGLCTDDVRAFGETTEVSGSVGRSLSLCSSYIRMLPSSQLKTDLSMMSQDVFLDGTIEGDVQGGCEQLGVKGLIKGSVDLDVNRLFVAPTGRVEGSLTYRGPDQAMIPPGAKISGPVSWSQKDRFEDGPAWPVVLEMGKLAILLSTVVFGIFAIMLLPGPFRRATCVEVDGIGSKTIAGLAFLILTPFVALAMAFTILGIPAALFVLTAYFLSSAIAWTVAVLATCRMVSSALRWRLHDLWLFIIGACAFGLVSSIVFIGVPLYFLTLCFGYGLMLTTIKRTI